MTTDKLKRNQLSEERFNWLKKAYIIIDSLDAATNESLYALDGEVVFGNRPAVQGRENIINMFKHFWTTIEGYSHSFVSIFGQDDAFAVETVVNYTRLNGTTIGIPAVTVIELNENDEIKSMRIFIDIAPLHQI